MKFDNRVKAIFCALFSALFFTACGPAGSNNGGDSAERSEPYLILSTVGMISDVVANIAGDHARVEALIGEGIDPHLYQPTRNDVVKLQKADVVFYNGLLLEGRMTDILVRLARADRPVRAVTEWILEESDYLLDMEDEPDYNDPHVWMDVQGWMRAVPVIVETLAAFDPANADDYKANAAEYLTQLEELNVYVIESMASIPESQRVLVTAHDAFQYMGRAYGLEVRGIQGVSTESEAGVRDLENLVNFIVERKIPAVFVETSVSDKNVRALVEGARARGHSIHIGGSLFSDAMGAAGTYEGTYIGMIDHNVTTIVNALGGEAKGFKRD